MDDGTAQQPKGDTSSVSVAQPVSVTSGGTGGLEREGPHVSTQERSSQASVETPATSERQPTESNTIQHHGVVAELPPDVKSLGGGTPASVAVVAPSSMPAVQLPVSDDTVMKGLHAKISNPLVWLTFWCIRKLKKAHIALKLVGGKAIRVKE